MPQLDKFIFITEVFWLVFGFLGFYFFILRVGLPQLLKILRYRSKYLLLQNNALLNLEQELVILKKQNIFFENVYISIYKNCPKELFQLLSRSLRNYFPILFISEEEKRKVFFILESIFKSIEYVYILRLLGAIRGLQNKNSFLLKVLK